MIGAVATAQMGMRMATERFEKAAERVAAPPAGGDPLPAVVDALAAETSLGINLAVLRSALAMQKQVLDILA